MGNEGVSRTDFLEVLEIARATHTDVQSSKSDMQSLKSDVQSLNSDIQGLRSEAFSRLEAVEMEQRLKEYIDERTHDNETRLLRAFADYDRNAGIRFRKLEADHSNLDTSATLRLGELERRVNEITGQIIALQSQSQRGQHPPS